MDVTMTRSATSTVARGVGCQISRASYFRQKTLEGSWMGNEQDALGAALKACAAGDRKGLAVIYQSEAARMVTVAQRILRRHDLAEEIVQEAFLQIWNKAWQYDASRGSARGWIFAIVRSRSLNALRDGGREDLQKRTALSVCRTRVLMPSITISSISWILQVACAPALAGSTACAARR